MFSRFLHNTKLDFRFLTSFFDDKCGVVEVDVVMMFGRSFSRRGFVGRIATPSSCRLNFFGRFSAVIKSFSY
jgi:hypothetical protein